MDYVALDTPCITFVTLGEPTEWTEWPVARSRGRTNIDLLDAWLETCTRAALHHAIGEAPVVSP